MLKDTHITVLVPAYNEATHLHATVHSIPSFVDQILIIDDGSTDHTAEVARTLCGPRIHVLRHTRNQGVGAAIKTGYRHAFQHHTDVAVVMAGDGQMHPDDLHTLLLPILSDQADYAKGNRLAHTSYHRMPVLRRWGSWLFSHLTHWATGLRVQDSQCGYTALSKAAYAKLPLDQLWPGYGYVNDLLALCAHQDLRVLDVTVRPIYGTEQSGLRFYHALFVLPFVLMRSVIRRALTNLPILTKPRLPEPF